MIRCAPDVSASVLPYPCDRAIEPRQHWQACEYVCPHRRMILPMQRQRAAMWLYVLEPSLRSAMALECRFMRS